MPALTNMYGKAAEDPAALFDFFQPTKRTRPMNACLIMPMHSARANAHCFKGDIRYEIRKVILFAPVGKGNLFIKESTYTIDDKGVFEINKT